MKRIVALIALLAAATFPAGTFAEEKPLKPMILASISDGTVGDKLASVKSALEKEGFEIAGEYEPYDGAYVVVVTSDELRQNAAKSSFGGYGAVGRVAITEVDGKVQVAFTHPVYMAHAYRLAGDLSGVLKRMVAALGQVEPFGSEKGLTPEKLRKYHYMFAMPYFDDHIRLAEYGSQPEAIEAVESGLAKGEGETARVYRVDVPGKDETLFGVAIRGGDGSDPAVMGVVDREEMKQTPHLPYEMLVSGGKVYALHGKFRIALSFPDLGMGTFMKISGAPGGIEKALRQAAGGNGK